MIFLKVLAWVIISILVISSVIFLVIEIGRKMNIDDDDDVTLTYDEFYQMYCIDPSKWELREFANNYFARYEIKRLGDYSSYETIYFKRTKDHYRFKRFVLNEKSRQNTEKANRKKLEILKSFQNDIDEYRKKYCGGNQE